MFHRTHALTSFDALGLASHNARKLMKSPAGCLFAGCFYAHFANYFASDKTCLLTKMQGLYILLASDIIR